MALFTRSTVSIIGPSSEKGQFLHLDLIAVAAQSGASDIGKFDVRMDNDTFIGVFGVYTNGEPISGGSTVFAAPCPPYCVPPASPSNPLVEV